MTDLSERFRELDRIATPDLEEELDRPRIEPLSGSPTRRVVAAGLALLIALGGFALATSAFLGEPPVERKDAPAPILGNGRIAIAQGPDQDIVLIDPDGSAPSPLVDRHGASQPYALDMAWSPDGSMLAYTDVRDDGTDGLFMLDLATGDVLDLSEGFADAAKPAWSPDGSRIAFTGFDGATGYDIFVVGADGTGRVPITAEADNGVDGAHMPSWSPDGARIAFAVDRYDDEATETEDHGIVVVDASGGNEIRLTTSLDEQPVWSRDGSKLAFLRKMNDVIELYVVNADGSGERRISGQGISTSLPAWSPDGSRLLFGTRDVETSNLGLVVVDVGNADSRTLLEDAYVASPVWSPDGGLIAFVRDDAGRPLPRVSLWVMRADGSDLMVLADGLDGVSDVAWQPIVGPVESPPPTESPPSDGAPLNPRVAATIQVGAFPRAVAVGEGAVWATVDNANGGPDDHLVVKIDPATNEIVGSVRLPEAGDLAVGEGAVWVLSRLAADAAVLRIDPSTDEVEATIPVGLNPSNVVVAEGAVWVTVTTTTSTLHPSGEVVRIDPATNEVVARIPVSDGWPRDVVVGEGSVWVYGHSGYSPEHGWVASSLWRIDPLTNELAAVVLDQTGFLGDGSYLPDNVVVGDGWLWAASDRGKGLRIDPTTGVFTTFELSEGGFAWPFLAYEGNVFFGLEPVRILDMETLEVVGSIPLESQVADAGLDPATGTLWIANYEGSVTRIDLR